MLRLRPQRWFARLCVVVLWGVATAADVGAQGAAPPAAANPLLGDWTLNLPRTHYGRGAAIRVREAFTCRVSTGTGTTVTAALAECTIRSVRRRDPHELVARFAAGMDGVARPVTGMPGMDVVSLSAVPGVAGAVDATFSAGRTPVYAYRAFLAADGRSLTIVAVDPQTRVVLTSIVVYDRVER